YYRNHVASLAHRSRADWMPRNFFRRIEVAFPIETPALRNQIVNDLIPTVLNDRVKARELQPDGIYRRLKPEGPEPRRQAQWQFREVSRERTKKLTGSKKKARADKLVPISVVHQDPATPATTSEKPFPP